MKRLVAICFLLAFTHINAASIGGEIGFGHYWAGDAGSSGMDFCGYVDIGSNNGFSVMPAIGVWTTSEYDITLTDLKPSVALMFSTSSGKLSTFYGFEPQLHIYLAEGMSSSYFGINGLGGLVIPVSPKTSLPIRVSYGLIFSEGGTCNIFTARIGLQSKI